jgi:uncharacterized protein YkwD
MALCYYCGKELETPLRCPYCNLTFCEEHIAQRDHNCIAASAKIKSVDEPELTDHVHYVESVEASDHRARMQPRRRSQRLLDLCEGVTPKKMALVALTLAISLGSILMLNSLEPQPETPEAGPVFPTTPEVGTLQEYVLGLINEERVKAELDELELDTNPIAQRYAESMLGTGEFKHNPELPGTMGENIKYHTSKEEFEVEDALQLMMYQMVYDDAEYDWGHRDNVLSEEYSRVSIGVASDGHRVYLVQDFS